jgi:hypothetical protein
MAGVVSMVRGDFLCHFLAVQPLCDPAAAVLTLGKIFVRRVVKIHEALSFHCRRTSADAVSPSCLIDAAIPPLLAVFHPETVLLAALSGFAGVKAFGVSLFALNGADQIGFLHLTRSYLHLLGYSLDSLNFHSNASFFCLIKALFLFLVRQDLPNFRALQAQCSFRFTSLDWHNLTI